MPGSEVDEIKSRLDIIEVISEYITLKQAGVNFRALCPFHREKTPSFFVSPERQLWKCFGCGESGDIFGFVMKIEGVEFPEALRLLAKKAGVELKRSDPHLVSQKTKLFDICSEAASFFNSSLYSPAGERVLAYLNQRKVSEASIKNFFLGYAPDSWDGLLKFLTQKGFREKDIEAAGLIIKKSQGGYYDRFRNRLIFPVSDPHGVIVGFGGRALDDKEEAKYLNSPETSIYNKSRLLYAVDKAKTEIKKNNYAILVEGYMDVIASHQAGVRNAVASAGTSLTQDQIKLLKRYSPNLILSFDIDTAGQEATKRGIDLLLEQEMNIKITVLEECKDPDELIKKDPLEWKKAIEKAKHIMEYYFDSTFKNLDLSKVEHKKKAAKGLLPIIAKIGDKIEQSHWLQKLSEKIKVDEKVLREVLSKAKKTVRPTFSKTEEKGKEKSKDKNLLLGEQIIGLILKGLALFPKKDDFFSEIINHLPLATFKGQELSQLAKELISCYNNFYQKDLNFDLIEFKKNLNSETLSTYSDFLIFNIEKDFAKIDKKILEKEIKFLIKELKRSSIFDRIKEMEEKMRGAEKENKKEEIKILTQKLDELIQELFKVSENTV